MTLLEADIWNPKFDSPCLQVVPTNLGWKANGENVMGRGVAKQAAIRYPHLSSWYGWICEVMANSGTMQLYKYDNLLLFPVKPLNSTKPHLSWQQPADLALVTQSTKLLADWDIGKGTSIVLPLVGCGNGGLPSQEVLSVLNYYLKDDRFLLVLTKTAYKELAGK